VAVRERIEVLRFRAVEAEVARARQAAEAKRYAEAQQAYERALAVSPESAFLRRELAAVQRETGRLDAALTNVRRAVDLDPSDARAFVTLGEIHAARTEFVAALGAFERAESIEPSEATRSKIRDVRERARLARLPDEYRSIPQTKELTRAQLAALVAVRLDHLVKGARSSDAAFITDTRGGWAEDFILRVARAGVMEVYPNYTFQPGVPVRRGELASVVSRLLTILAGARPALADRWRNPQYAFSDLPPGHLSYPAAALAVTSGVMPALEGNTFQLSRVVTGAEAIAAVERIEKLTTSR
jgi:tetratricopeptide (TPR) repeat protein